MVSRKTPSEFLVAFLVTIVLFAVLFSGSPVHANAVIWTNKPDYSPGEIVTIYGMGFGSRASVIIVVTRPDGSVNPPPWRVFADASGDFATTYQLDGIVGTYTVDATDGTNSAQTTFTDASANLDQCTNGGVGNPPEPCRKDATYANWVNGNANSAKSHWREGEFISYRDTIVVDSAGTHVFTIQYPVVSSSKHAIDYLGSFDATETTSLIPTASHANRNDPVTDKLGTTYNPASPTSTYPIPLANLINCGGSSGTPPSQIPGSFAIWGPTGTIITNVAYPVQNVPSGGGSCDTQVAITFTTTSAATVVLAWGGHISREADWGAGYTAYSISGSPFHMSQVSLTSNGVNKNIGAQDRALAASSIFFSSVGIQTVIKNSVGNPVTSVTTGAAVHDTATLSGTSSTAGGTVTYKRFNNGFCSGTPVSTQSVTVTSAVVPDSSTFTPTTAGFYSYQAVYSGDSRNAGATSPCEPLTVTGALPTPTLTTVIKDSSNNTVTSVPSGTSIHDTAALSGGSGSMTGTVTYSFFTNGVCSGIPTSTQTVGPIGSSNVVPDSSAQTLNVGYYSYQAQYSGDANNNPAISPCEPLTVTGSLPTPTLTTVIQDSSGYAVTSVPSGTSIHDTAALSGGSGSMTGTVTYSFFTNGVCSGIPTSTQTVTIGSSNVVPDSSAQTPNVGYYSYQAQYGGNANNNPTTSLCEPLTVTSQTQGQLVIVKNTVGSDATFGFTVSGPSSSTPTILTSGGTGTTGPLTVTAGTYNVSETTIPLNWVLTTASCAGGSGSMGTFTNPTVSGIVVGVGETVTCTFTDTTHAELDITKSGPAQAVAGSNITYTGTLTNLRGGTAYGVVLVDQLPTDMCGTVYCVTFVGSSHAATYDAGTNKVTWNLGDLPPGASIPGWLTVHIDPNTPDNTVFTDKFTVTWKDRSGNTVGSDDATWQTTVHTHPQLTIAKEGPTTAVVGQNFSYTITISNVGGTNATNVALTDTLPTGLSYVSSNPTADSHNGIVAWNNLGTIGPGGTKIVTLTVSVASSVSNGAVLNDTAGVTWKDSAGNSYGPVQDTWDTTVYTLPKLEITKFGPTEAVTDTTITYTGTLTNVGGSTANNVVLVDQLPTDMCGSVFCVTFVSSSHAATYDAGTNKVTWNLGSIPAGVSIPGWLTVHIDPNTPDNTVLTDTFTVTGDGGLSDTATWDTTVHTHPQLTIEKTGPEQAFPGQSLTYTISIRNLGGTPAENVVLQDVLPADALGKSMLIYVSSNPSGTPDVSPPDTGVVTWNLGTIPAYGTVEVSITVTVSNTVGNNVQLADVASVAWQDSYGNHYGPEGAAAYTTVFTRPLLVIEKTGPATTYPGSTFNYTITINNVGGTNATDVVLTDTLPAGLSFVSSNPTADSVIGGTVTWNLGTIGLGGSKIVTLTVSVDGSVPNGTPLDNVAEVSWKDSAGGSYGPASDVWETVSYTPPQLTVTKTGPTQAVYVGDQFAYEIQVCNIGGTSASSVVLQDQIPVGVSYFSSNQTADSHDGVVTWTFASITSGECKTVTLTLTVGQLPVPMHVINTASATWKDSAGDSYGPAFATAETEITAKGSIVIVKNAIGGDGTFDFTGTLGSFQIGTSGGTAQASFPNLLPGQQYSVTESVPNGWDLTGLSCSSSGSASAISTDFANAGTTITLAAGESVTCTFTDTKLGTIVVEKQTIPDGDPQQFRFTGDAAGSISDGQQIVKGGLLPGTYTSTETVPSGWKLADIACNDTNSSGDLVEVATFNLDAGETVKCTFRNEKPCKWCTKSAVLSQVEQNVGKCCDTPDIIVDLRLTSDMVDEAKLRTSEPATGSLQAAVDYINLHGDLNGDGALFIGVTAKDCWTDTVGSGPCIGQPGRAPYGGGAENVVITNTRSERLNVFGCSVTLQAEDPSKPVVSIVNSKGKVTVLDVHVTGSNVAGYLIQNNSDLVVVKNARAMKNGVGYLIKDDKVEITGSPEISGNGVGLQIVGNSIILRTNKVLSNTGVGVDIQGNNNAVGDEDVEGNGGHGIVVKGGSNEIKGNDVFHNGGDGINIAGNNNLITSNDVGDKAMGNTGDGIHVQGNGNTLDGNTAFGNGGDGIEVAGNNNIIKRSSVGDLNKGNGGDGIRLAGYGNKLQENNVYANTGDGIDVSGGTLASPNVIYKNKVGDRGKGNGGNGIKVAGAGNGKSNPIEVDSNTVKSNGLVGIQVTGSGHQLKNNVSGGSLADDNGDCEFDVAIGNFNATGNKANGVTIPGISGSNFPTGCIGTP